MRDTGFTEDWLAERLSKMKPKPLKSTVDVPSRSPKRETDNQVSAPSKYRNKKTVIAGEAFDSKKEADRWLVLRDKERTGEIRNLTRQVRMPLEIDGIRVCVYVCDFRYEARVPGMIIADEGKRWRTIYEDTKGMRTPVYLLKKKLVRALLKIEILET